MSSKRRRAWVGFALFAALVIVGLFVLDGALAGATFFVAMLVFLATCIYALRGEDRDARADDQRARRAGWFVGWF